MAMEDDAPVLEIKREDCIDLPPGFRFHPTDEEIITHYLLEKVLNSSFSATAVGEADLNKCEPWDLPKKAKMGEKEWFFFCQRDRKYPSGMRTNRATEAGYWKATGKDKEIYKGKGCLVGMKKTLVFYRGRAPKGEKTNWVMNEYRLEGKFSHHTLPNTAKGAWVVCKVFHKRTEVDSTNPVVVYNSSSSSQLPAPADLLMDPSHCINSNGPACSSSFMRSIKDDDHDQSTEFSYLATCINDSDHDDHQEDHKSLILQAKTHNQVNNISPNQMDVLINPLCNFRGTSDSSYYCVSQSGSCNSSSVPSLELSTVVAENKNLHTSSNQSRVLSVPQDGVWGSSTAAVAVMNTQISSFSGVSKQHMRRSSISYEGFDVESAPSSAPLLDLEFLWNY